MTMLLRRLIVPPLGVLALLPALVFAHSDGRWLRKEVNAPAPNFTLLDQDERTVSLRDLRGRVVLIDFIFTYCPAGCLLSTGKFRQVQHVLGDKPVHIVSVSIDPAHDTPPALRAYAKKFGVDLRQWSFLTGTADAIERVRTLYRIPLERQAKRDPDGEIRAIAIADHGLKAYAVDRQGMKRFEYWGQDFDPKVVIQDVTTLVEEGR
jgi:protein SCO1